FRASHKADEPVPDVRKHPLGHADIVMGDVALREPLRFEQHLARVRKGDAGNGLALLLHGLTPCSKGGSADRRPALRKSARDAKVPAALKVSRLVKELEGRANMVGGGPH